MNIYIYVCIPIHIYIYIYTHVYNIHYKPMGGQPRGLHSGGPRLLKLLSISTTTITIHIIHNHTHTSCITIMCIYCHIVWRASLARHDYYSKQTNSRIWQLYTVKLHWANNAFATVAIALAILRRTATSARLLCFCCLVGWLLFIICYYMCV